MLNQSKQRSESSTCCCFWSGVSKRGVHLENNLRIPKDSCKIVNTLPFYNFKMSAISRILNLRSPKTILWTFVMFRGTTADFGRPERSASSVFVRPRLNSAYQSMIYPLFWKWQKLLHQNLCNFWTKRQIVMKFWHLTYEGWYILFRNHMYSKIVMPSMCQTGNLLNDVLTLKWQNHGE